MIFKEETFMDEQARMTAFVKIIDAVTLTSTASAMLDAEQFGRNCMGFDVPALLKR